MTNTDERLVLLTARNGARAAKRFRLEVDETGKEKVVADSYGSAKTFSIDYSRPFNSLDGLHAAILDLQDRPTTFAVRGEPLPTANMRNTRRLIRPCRKNGDPATFSGAARRWVMFDVDGLETATPVDPATAPETAVEAVLAALPPELSNADLIWQWSSSQGLKGTRLSLHLFALLDRPLTDSEVKSWVLDVNERAGVKLLDPALYQPVQPHYVAAPEFVGFESPIPRRIGIRRSSSPTLHIEPPLDISANANALHFTPVASSDITASQQSTPSPKKKKILPLFFMPPGEAVFETQSEALKRHLNSIGGAGGFYQPILSAIGCAVKLSKSYEIDLDAMVQEVQRRVMLAPADGRDAATMAKYSSDEWLTELLEWTLANDKTEPVRRREEEDRVEMPEDFYGDMLADAKPLEVAPVQDLDAFFNVAQVEDLPVVTEIRGTFVDDIDEKSENLYDIALPADETDALAVLADRFRFSPTEDLVYDVVTRQSISRANFKHYTALQIGDVAEFLDQQAARLDASAAQAGKKGKSKPADPVDDCLLPHLIKKCPDLHVHGNTYRYGDMSTTVIEPDRKIRMVNTYRPGDLMNSENHLAETPASWLAALEVTIPDEKFREKLLDFFAFIIQKPGQRAIAMPVIIGQQGIGKGKIFKPIEKIVGAKNVARATAEDLSGKFNAWATAGVVFFDEMVLDADGKSYTRLKSWLGDGDGDVGYARIERKREDAVTEEIRGNAYATSNCLAALGGVEKTDRRLKVYVSPCKSERDRRAENDGVDPLGAVFAGVMQDDEVRRIAHFLANRDIENADLRGDWSDASHLAEVSYESLDDCGKFISSLIDEGAFDDVGVMQVVDCMTYVQRIATSRSLLIRITTKGVSRAMEILGWSKIQEGHGQIWLTDGRRVRLWCRSETLGEIRTMDRQDLTALFDASKSAMVVDQ